MAEQHQHKNTMGMPFRSPMGNNPAAAAAAAAAAAVAAQVNPNRNNMVNSQHSFANDFGQFNNSDSHFMNNANGPNSQFELAAKQEMMFSQQQSHHMPPQMQTKINPNTFNKQQFQYASPNTIGTVKLQHKSPFRLTIQFIS